MSTTAHDVHAAESFRGSRKYSTVEVAGESGGSDVLDLNELSEQDRELAQFGYKPVHICHLSFPSPSLQQVLLNLDWNLPTLATTPLRQS